MSTEPNLVPICRLERPGCRWRSAWVPDRSQPPACAVCGDAVGRWTGQSAWTDGDEWACSILHAARRDWQQCYGEGA